MPLYLGLDSSTQSLTAIVIEVADRGRRVVLERTLVFDEALPSYGTRHGVLLSDDPRIAAAPPLMWAEALDLMMGTIASSGLDLGAIDLPVELAIGGDAPPVRGQHRLGPPLRNAGADSASDDERTVDEKLHVPPDFQRYPDVDASQFQTGNLRRSRRREHGRRG